ncbi:MAG: type II toxin-antitoxin system HicA family toxin [Solirubrobacterales bacterium]
MIKHRDLLRWLRQHGCSKVRQGSKHEVWEHDETAARSSVPRHKEIPEGTCTAICEQLGIPSL